MRMLHVVSLVLFVCAALPVHAARIYLDPEEMQHDRLDTFYVPVRIDVAPAECINAVDVAVAYDPTEITVLDVAVGSSILTLWTEKPTIAPTDARTGRVTFSGGIPGGYCGRVEGDPGRTNILAELVVTGTPQALAAGSINVTQVLVEPGTVAYVHDGTGTRASTTVLGTALALVQATSSPTNLWLADVKQDSVSPELFDVTLVRGPSVGNARHYIVFSTTDKQSGVDHYEVLETDPDRFGFLSWLSKEAYWTIAESPYVLRDQNLHSKILVKAVDKNGNERVAEYIPPMSPLVEITRPSILIPLAGVLVVVLLVVVLVVHVRRRHASLSSVHVDASSNEETL